jgi:hypothetical protein
MNCSLPAWTSSYSGPLRSRTAVPPLKIQAYYQYQAFMEDILRGAVVEFEQLGKALNKVADAYDDAERVIELDLDKIYGV